MKIIIYIVASLVVIFAGVGFLVWRGLPVPKDGLSDIRVTIEPSSQPMRAVIEGGLMSSGNAVTGTSYSRDGRRIVIKVLQGPVIPKLFPHRREGRFRVEVPITGIDSIAFQKTSNVVWHR